MSKEFLEALKKLRYTRNNYQGICSQVRINETVLYPLFRKWPNFSGCIEFPIPHPLHPKNKDKARDAYCTGGGNKWDGSDYGKLRWELLEFMIAELEKEHGTH